MPSCIHRKSAAIRRMRTHLLYLHTLMTPIQLPQAAHHAIADRNPGRVGRAPGPGEGHGGGAVGGQHQREADAHVGLALPLPRRAAPRHAAQRGARRPRAAACVNLRGSACWRAMPIGLHYRGKGGRIERPRQAPSSDAPSSESTRFCRSAGSRDKPAGSAPKAPHSAGSRSR